jgi:hypothetical protein
MPWVCNSLAKEGGYLLNTKKKSEMPKHFAAKTDADRTDLRVIADLKLMLCARPILANTRKELECTIE